jgi:predicted nucleotidyltransferase
MERNPTLAKPDLEKVVQAVLAVCEPKAVILFGSHARGDAHQYSDLDLLVIRQKDFRSGESRRKELGRIYRSVSQACAIPKDILLLTNSEFLEWRNTTNHMAAVAWKEGRVLYGQV